MQSNLSLSSSPLCLNHSNRLLRAAVLRFLSPVAVAFWIILATCSTAFSDWSRYKPFTLEQIADVVTNSISDEGHDMGVTSWTLPYRIKLVIRDYPKPSKRDEFFGAVKLFGLTQLGGRDITADFREGYSLIATAKGMRIRLLFQDVLVPYFEREVTLGKEVELYVICGCYSDAKRELLLLVNEFRDPNLTK